jgi:mannose-6-phosphate isomerase-like protein (cupin superfamily)
MTIPRVALAVGLALNILAAPLAVGKAQRPTTPGIGSLMISPGWANAEGENQPTFTKSKFAVPLLHQAVNDDWTARGYSNPKVESYAAGWSRGDHTHPVSLIMTVGSGRMEFVFTGQRFVVEPGDELLYAAHTVHSARNVYDGTTQMLESYKRP